MTEMNELTRSLVRVEELLNSKEIAGALNCLWIAQGHALTAVKLINVQASLINSQSSILSNQQIKINELSERLKFFEDEKNA